MKLERIGVVDLGMVEFLQEYQVGQMNIFMVFKVEMMEEGI
jgi:hypothetical protein